jgi:23S rRNA-/tRNA-specific pseudouridylate synthase
MNINEEPEAEEQDLFEHHRLVMSKGQQLLRIDKFLMTRIENATRTKIQQAAEAGNILVNDKPVKSNSKGLEQAERVLMELHQKTGLDSMLWIWEAIQGNMSVSSIVLNLKSEIHN